MPFGIYPLLNEEGMGAAGDGVVVERFPGLDETTPSLWGTPP